MKKLLILLAITFSCSACALWSSDSCTCKDPKKMSLDDFDNDPADTYVKGSKPKDFGDGLSLYATESWLYNPAPKMIVETWVNGEPPKMDGKFVIVSYWNTWCPPSRRSLKLLDKIQRAYPDDVVAIAICDEDPEDIQAFLNSRPDYAIKFAADTQARNKKELGIYGVPHWTLLEPTERVVVWEGFPMNEAHPFNVEKMKSFIDILKNAK